MILDCCQAANFVGKGYEYAASTSYILLAGCSKEEKSYESRQTLRGEFTQGLTTLLRDMGSERITYEDVIKRLPDLPRFVPLFLSCEKYFMRGNKANTPLRGQIW